MQPITVRHAGCVEKRLRLGRERADEARVVGVRHEPWLQPVARVDLLVGGVGQKLGDGRIPRRHHLPRRALGSGQTTELPHRHIDALFLRRRHVRELRQPGIADHRQQADLARVDLRPQLLQLADAEVQRVVQDADQQVTAALERRDDRRDARALLHALERLAFERRRVGGAPPALARARGGDGVAQCLEAAVGRRVEDLRVVEHVDQGLQVAVARWAPCSSARCR